MAGENAILKVDKDLLEKVERLASTGLNVIQIGQALGVSEKTIMNYKKRHPELHEAWKRGKYKAIAKVANALFDKAVNEGDVNAQKYWLARQGGTSWKESIDVNLIPKPMVIERFGTQKEVVLGAEGNVEDAEITED